MEFIYSTELIKTINEKDIPLEVISFWKYLRAKYGITLRISMLLQIIKDFLNISEFDIIDERQCNNGPIESYCIDRFIDWSKGKSVNFSEMFRKICDYYTFSKSEKLRLEEGKVDEKLWAFFLALSKLE